MASSRQERLTGRAAPPTSTSPPENCSTAPPRTRYRWWMRTKSAPSTAVARALINQPLLVLADEPTGNLDRKNSAEILDLLRLCHKNLGQTILLVTHDESLAAQADRVITLSDGRIVSDRPRG